MRPAITLPIITSLSIICLTTGCQSAGPRVSPEQQKDNLATLTNWMIGSFSSATQARVSPDGYRDIRLQVAPIWTSRPDGPWLYVEQAAATALEQPYRQRVYRLVARNDGAIESQVYELPGDPLRFAGAWRDTTAFAALTPSDLQLRDGCKLILWRQDDGSFAGCTVDDACLSEWGGAAYATSEAVITADGMVSWDRGWNTDGEQVWGATAGGYEFDRISPTPGWDD